MLDAFLDELSATMRQEDQMHEQQRRGGTSAYRKGVRRVVLLAGGGYPSQDKQAEHLGACKDAVRARAGQLGWSAVT